MDYITLNRKTYDQTAEEFGQKIALRLNGDEKIVNKLNDYLENIDSARVLDIGPGNGQMSKLLCDKGYEVVGIEFSEPMSKISQDTAPAMKLIVDNFLTHDFGVEKFSGILSVAFIHLFPEIDRRIVLNKIYTLLSDNGYALISTTKHDTSEECLMQKENFNENALRFRKRFTKEELTEELLDTKFEIVEYYENEDTENSNKEWMTFIVKK